eukprot:2917533-Amphidinium_carterae.1
MTLPTTALFSRQLSQPDRNYSRCISIAFQLLRMCTRGALTPIMHSPTCTVTVAAHCIEGEGRMRVCRSLCAAHAHTGILTFQGDGE